MDIREKPMWRLTKAEIDQLDKQEQQWVINALHDMRQDGSLAMLRANPEGTIYETAWDRDGEAWKLRPMRLIP